MIFYLNCEHVLFVYILKQRRKIFSDLKKKFADFQEINFFTKLKTFKTHFFKFLSFINLPCGHVMSHKKFGPDRFSRFDVYWIQTDRQKTNRQAKFIYRLKKPIVKLFWKRKQQYHQGLARNTMIMYHDRSNHIPGRTQTGRSRR